MIEIAGAGRSDFNSIENYIVRRIQSLEGQVERLTREKEDVEARAEYAQHIIEMILVKGDVRAGSESGMDSIDFYRMDDYQAFNAIEEMFPALTSVLKREEDGNG